MNKAENYFLQIYYKNINVSTLDDLGVDESWKSFSRSITTGKVHEHTFLVDSQNKPFRFSFFSEWIQEVRIDIHIESRYESTEGTKIGSFKFNLGHLLSQDREISEELNVDEENAGTIIVNGTFEATVESHDGTDGPPEWFPCDLESMEEWEEDHREQIVANDTDYEILFVIKNLTLHSEDHLEEGGEETGQSNDDDVDESGGTSESKNEGISTRRRDRKALNRKKKGEKKHKKNKFFIQMTRSHWLIHDDPLHQGNKLIARTGFATHHKSTYTFPSINSSWNEMVSVKGTGGDEKSMIQLILYEQDKHDLTNTPIGIVELSHDNLLSHAKRKTSIELIPFVDTVQSGREYRLASQDRPKMMSSGSLFGIGSTKEGDTPNSISITVHKSRRAVHLSKGSEEYDRLVTTEYEEYILERGMKYHADFQVALEREKMLSDQSVMLGEYLIHGNQFDVAMLFDFGEGSLLTIGGSPTSKRVGRNSLHG